MKLMQGAKFKIAVAPDVFRKYELIGKNANGNFIVEDLKDGKRYVRPFLNENFCLPLNDHPN